MDTKLLHRRLARLAERYMKFGVAGGHKGPRSGLLHWPLLASSSGRSRFELGRGSTPQAHDLSGNFVTAPSFFSRHQGPHVPHLVGLLQLAHRGAEKSRRVCTSRAEVRSGNIHQNAEDPLSDLGLRHITALQRMDTCNSNST